MGEEGGLGRWGRGKGGSHLQSKMRTPLATALASDPPRMLERCPQGSCPGLEGPPHWEQKEDRIKVSATPPAGGRGNARLASLKLCN